MRSLTLAGQTAWKPRRILKAALLSGFCLWSAHCSVNALAADLQINAIPSATEVAVNDRLTYTIIVNYPVVGPTLSGFLFVVEIPREMRGMVNVVNEAGYPWDCHYEGHPDDCVLQYNSDFHPGDHAEARFTVTARSEGAFTPLFWANYMPLGINLGAKSYSGVLTPTAVSFRPAPPNLDVTHTARPEPAFVGGDLTYSTRVANAGFGLANDTTLTIALPAGVEYRSVMPAGSCELTSRPQRDLEGLITCHLGTIERATVISVTTIVRPMTPGTIRSRAEATAVAAFPVSADRYTSNNSRIATTTVNPSADLALVKTASVVSGGLGSNVTYHLTVTNNGPSLATDVIVTDNLPLGLSRTLEPVPATPPAVTLVSSPASCTRAGATLTCNLGNLAPSVAAATITVVLRVTDTRTLTNTASVRANEHDPVTANNTATIATMVTVMRPPPGGVREPSPGAGVPVQSPPAGPPPQPMIPAKPPLPGAPSKPSPSPSK